MLSLFKGVSPRYHVKSVQQGRFCAASASNQIPPVMRGSLSSLALSGGFMVRNKFFLKSASWRSVREIYVRIELCRYRFVQL